MPNGSTGYAGNGSYSLPGGNEIKIDSEVMLVTAGWGTTTLTVQRGFQGTTAASHSNGATVTWVPDYFSNNITIGVSGDADVNGPYNDVFLSWQNLESTNPDWVNVGNTSTGSISTQPNGTNFALQNTSPSIGYGTTNPPFNFLPSQATDAGACAHQLSTCP